MLIRIILLFLVLLLPGVSSSQISFQDAGELKAYFRWTEEREPLISAHRGGPYPGYPENCIATFEHVLRYTGAIIECDVEMTQDSCLIMMHDKTLERTTTGTGKVNEHTCEDIRNLFLKDPDGRITECRIPTLEEVLNWTKEKAILTLDVKQGVPYKMVTGMIEKTGAAAYTVVITYNLQQALEVHHLDPDLMLSVSLRNREEFDRLKASGIPLENVIAFTGTYLKDHSFYSLLHSHGIFCILGTMGNLDQKAVSRGDIFYLELYRTGADILATDRPVEVFGIINSHR